MFWSLLAYKAGRIFYLILKVLHHKINKKPLVAAKVTIPNCSTPHHEWMRLQQLWTKNVRNWPKKSSGYVNESDLMESTNCVNSWYGVGVNAFIHNTELMWCRKAMVQSWCDLVKSWYGVDESLVCGWCDSAKSGYVVSVYTVHCTVGFMWQILCLCLRAKICIRPMESTESAFSEFDPSKSL
jgi:hypothetical protein